MEVGGEPPPDSSDHVHEEAAPDGAAGRAATGGAGGGEIFRPRDPLDAPLRKLTINLIHTYKRINEVYYAAKHKRLQSQKNQKREYNNGYDDEEYNYKVRENEIFNEHYIIDKRIGKGSFGQVVRAFDRNKKMHVAIKIIKSRKPFTKQAQTEINLLEYLNSKDPGDKWFIVRLLDNFVHRNHTCLVFELLSYNLYDLLRNTSFNGVSLNLIRKFGLQLLQALAFLSLPEINVVHCDLKPENILLRHPRRSAIKVIDFGSSCYGEKRMYKYIQSRFYRSPEVILGLDYGVGIDMWSLGCILVEMHTGEPLFNGTDEADQIRRIVGLRGLPPAEMLSGSPKLKQFFDKSDGDPPTYTIRPSRGRGDGSGDGKSSGKRSRGKADKDVRTLEGVIGVYTGGPTGRRKGEAGHTEQDYLVFLDLIDKMLKLDPAARITPVDALQHPFFNRLPGRPAAVGKSNIASTSSDGTQTGPSSSSAVATSVGAAGAGSTGGGSAAGAGTGRRTDEGACDSSTTKVDQCTQTPREDADSDVHGSNMDVEGSSGAGNPGKGASGGGGGKGSRGGSSSARRSRKGGVGDAKKIKGKVKEAPPANPNAGEGKD
jgi:dual specificity tyrosine-phosphorylation-regulated kinase 1